MGHPEGWRIVARPGCQRHLGRAVVRGRTADWLPLVSKQERVMKKSIIFAALAVIATAPVLAGTPHINAREHNQRARIYNGVASGELTRPETRRLAAGQVHLNRVEA